MAEIQSDYQYMPFLQRQLADRVCRIVLGCVIYMFERPLSTILALKTQSETGTLYIKHSSQYVLDKA